MLLKANRRILLYLLMWTIMVTCSARGVLNRLVGIKYISFTNFDGTIANGSCCDEPGKLAGSCTPNMCDTAFAPCGTSDANDPCNVLRDQLTPVIYNSSLINFGKFIGNHVNKTTSFLVIKFPYDKNNINFTIKVYEMLDSDGTDKEDIAEFKFTIDWVYNKFISPPEFHRFVLNDTRAQLVLDVVSQCSRHYFTDDCSVYCRPDKIHYTCMNNGTIQCFPGWEGQSCQNQIDYCPENQCQNGATCVPVFLNYTCTCPLDYTGFYCETSTTATTTTSTAPTTSTSTASTTTTSTAPTTTTSTAPTTTTTTSPTTTTSTASFTASTTTTTTTAPTTTNSTAPTTTTTIISQSSNSDGDESRVIGISGFLGLFFNIQVTGDEPSRKHSNASTTTTRVEYSG